MHSIPNRLEKLRISLDEVMFKFFYKKHENRYVLNFKKPEKHFSLPKKKLIKKQKKKIERKIQKSNFCLNN